MLNLTKLETAKIKEILEDNGYSSDDILHAEFVKVDAQNHSIYNVEWYDNFADEGFGETLISIYYMANGTIWAEV